MEVNIVNYGIAKDIMKGTQVSLQLGNDATIKELKDTIINQFPAFKELRSLKFAVHEDYQPDTFELKEGDEVVIIPPVSGG